MEGPRDGVSQRKVAAGASPGSAAAGTRPYPRLIVAGRARKHRAMTGECPVCGGAELEPLIERRSVPLLLNRVFDDADAARHAGRGALTLVMCAGCGFTFNRAFDAAAIDYSVDYENDQSGSLRFRRHIEGVIARIREHDTTDATVIEIGGGQGGFLASLLQGLDRGPAAAFGFDPAYRGPERGPNGERYYKAYFGPETAGLAGKGPALVICRHVIEHVPDPLGFLRDIRAAIADADPVRLFIETPCLEWILRHTVIQDLFYEHCNYWTKHSLRSAVSAAGFTPERVDHVFDGQYLWLEASAGPAEGLEPRAPLALARAYVGAEARAIGAWNEAVRSHAANGGVALWGAGAKGVTMANMIDPKGALIACLIDINPRKQNRYVPLSAHRILDPATASAAGVRSAMVMNPNYTAEIAAMIEDAGIDMTLTDATTVQA